MYALTESGEVVLGSKKVPIVNTVTLQAATPKRTKKLNSPNWSRPKTGLPSRKRPNRFPAGLLALSTARNQQLPAAHQLRSDL
jgi:hypothetical protein